MIMTSNIWIEKLKALYTYSNRYINWMKKANNQILLFSIILISLPLLLLNNICTEQTYIITFAIWLVGVIISVIFWRIRDINFFLNQSIGAENKDVDAEEVADTSE